MQSLLFESSTPSIEIGISEAGIPEMANAAELTTKVERLEERLNNHIWFFRIVAVALAAWLGWLTNVILDVRGSVARNALSTTNSQQTVSQKLQSIEVRQSLAEYAVAKPDDLKSNLPKVSSTLAAATKENIKASPTVLSNLQNKLAALEPTTPDYWHTAGEFITYRSQISVLNYQKLVRSDLPNCVDKPPIPMTMTMDAETEKGLIGQPIKPGGTHEIPALYENCRFTLDSPEEKSMIPELGRGRSYVLEFRRCQIIYRGGPITLLAAHPHPTAITAYGPTRSDVFILIGQTIIFEDCLFQFNIAASPVPDGQNLTRQLLSQSGSTLTVKFSIKSEPS